MMDKAVSSLAHHKGIDSSLSSKTPEEREKAIDTATKYSPPYERFAKDVRLKVDQAVMDKAPKEVWILCRKDEAKKNTAAGKATQLVQSTMGPGL
jgi:hypothetical protein